ncbi:hypothetical protein RyT2_16810 [Pseudolactococcus yaeyamensis]
MIVIGKKKFAAYFTDTFDDLFSLKNEVSLATILSARLFHRGIKRETIEFYELKGLAEDDILPFRDLMLALKEQIVSLDRAFTKTKELRKVERNLQGVFFSKKIF